MGREGSKGGGRAALAIASLAVALSGAEHFGWQLLGRAAWWIPVFWWTLAVAGVGAGATAAATYVVSRRSAIATGTALVALPFALHFAAGAGPVGIAKAALAVVLVTVSTVVAVWWLKHVGRQAVVHAVAGLMLVAAWTQYALLGTSRATPARADLPDVILLVLDTTRYDHLSVYGYDSATTPRLQEFAGDAEIYENAWSVAPWTPSSHASLLTGLLPAVHGADGQEAPPLSNDLVTLPRVLSRAGYATAGFVANPNLMGPGWADHFDRYRPSWYVGAHTAIKNLNLLFRASGDGWEIDASTQHVLARARRWWNASDGGPRFLFLNVMDPHAPYRPPDRFFRRHLPGVSSAEAYAVQQDWYSYFVNPGVPAHDAAILRGLYDAEVASLDDQVGEFFDWLDAGGDLDDTIVVVTADHGERLSERGVPGHLVLVDPYVLRVPLIVRYGDRLAARRIERRVQTDGVPGYVLDLAGLEAPPQMADVALQHQDRAVVVAQAQDPIIHLQSVAHVIPEFDPERLRGDIVFVADARYALVWRWLGTDTGEAQLFDLTKDPEMYRDVAAAHPNAVARLKEVALGLPRFTDAARGTLDPALLERLRSLGYLR